MSETEKPEIEQGSVAGRPIEGLSCFPPRDHCLVAPRIIVTEHNYTIVCDRCGTAVTKPSYRQAYIEWWNRCM